MTGHSLVQALGLATGPLAHVLAVFDGAGEEARVVGGAVRNVLLGLPPGDIDIATTAIPAEVIRRANAAGFRPVSTGIEHGTITVVANGIPFEVTTLRQDVETFGRKAKVAFGRDWRIDAERRDFTINALFVSRDGTVHDYVGGRADLTAHRVRFIGDPEQRIGEDYLRILRFFRFHASYGTDAPDAPGLRACIRARSKLDTLSRERVRMELIKLLVAPRAVPTLAVMAEVGILGPVLGGVPQLASLGRMIEIEAASGKAADATRRLGSLAVQVSEDAERLGERLRLTNAEAERLRSMGEAWWRLAPNGGETLLYRLGELRYLDRVLLAWARSQAGAADARWQRLASLPGRWRPPVFPLRAADFLARGLTRGPALGQALAAAEEAWIARGFPGEAGALAAIADEAAAKAR